MSAIKKTKSLQRIDMPISSLVKNEANPNKMSSKAFDLLCDNIEKTGITDAILVRPMDGGKYRIVGGHHRYDAAIYLGFTHVPVTVIDHEDFDEDAETFQIVRMNMIRGAMDPQAFMDMFNRVADKYGDDILQDAFGFSDETEWKKMIASTAKSLPTKQMQDKFKEAAKEIKTIDGLSTLLNTIFTKYGDTLPYGFMVFDYANQKQVWLRIEHKTLKAMDIIGDMCIEQNRTVDDLIGRVLQLIAQGELSADRVIKETPETVLPKKKLLKLKIKPTKNNLENMAAVN